MERFGFTVNILTEILRRNVSMNLRGEFNLVIQLRTGMGFAGTSTSL